MRANSKKSDERAPPCKPARFPATERSWQGNPPQRRSGDSFPLLAHSRTSVQQVTVGQCWARIPRRHLSDSHCQMTRIPARSSPRSSPPIPEKRLPTVTMFLVAGGAGPGPATIAASPLHATGFHAVAVNGRCDSLSPRHPPAEEREDGVRHPAVSARSHGRRPIPHSACRRTNRPRCT